MEPVNELEEGLVYVAGQQDDHEAYAAFLTMLLNAEVLVLGMHFEQGFQPISLTAGDDDQRQGIPFFTSQPRLDQAMTNITESENLVTLNVQGASLWQMAIDGKISTFLNPFNEVNKEFLAAEMADIMNNVVGDGNTDALATAGEVLVSEPTDIPPTLTEGLRKYFDAFDGIKSATLAWMRQEDGLECYLLEIETEVDPPLILENLSVDLPPGQGLNARFVHVGGEDAMTADIKPFYTQG